MAHSFSKFVVADLKSIGASFSQMLTSVMISRLILNLRGVGESSDSTDRSVTPWSIWRPSSGYITQDENLTRTIPLGDLGEGLCSWEDNSIPHTMMGPDVDIA